MLLEKPSEEETLIKYRPLGWAVRKPVERRVVILLTAFPVVFGMFTVALIGFVGGESTNIWILIKTAILMIAMLISYKLARKMNEGKD